jgi:hypothetical protein
MTAGDILSNVGLRTRTYTMKTNTDAVAGQLYCDDGSGGGLVAATAALAALNKVVMVLKAHDYSEETNHVVPCVEQGYVEVVKKTGTAVKATNKLTVSATAGQVDKFVAGDVTATVNEANVEAAEAVNLAVIGYAIEATSDTATTQKMWLGN